MGIIKHDAILPYIEWNGYVITTYPSVDENGEYIWDRFDLDIALDDEEMRTILRKSFNKKELLEKISNEVDLSELFGIKGFNSIRNDKAYFTAFLKLIEEAPFCETRI